MKPSWIGHSWTGAAATVLPRVVSAQYSERPPWGSRGRRLHRLWVLDYARNDCGLARVGSSRAPWQPRRARTANLYAPGTPYWEDPSASAGPLREAWAIFAGGEEAGLAGLLDRRKRWAVIADPAGLLEAPLHEMALAGQSRGEAGFWRAQAALATLMDLLNSATRESDVTRGEDACWILRPAGPPARAAGIVEAAGEYFREHLAQRVTLSAVARHLRMSESAFSHGYAQQAGLSPMAALGAMRIALVRNLLLRGLKMDAIARQAGFCDAFHLSKAFRKHCGVSPSAFRRGFGNGDRQ
jgi:AraC-like DNA-binding protein